jgi:polar amino acid transport system substrate-binding protein
MIMKAKQKRMALIGVVLCLFYGSAAYAQERLVISQSGGVEFMGQTIAFRFLRVAYQEMGMTIEVQSYPAERAAVVANSGATAGVLTRMEGLEKFYPNLVRVPVPVTYLDMMAFTRNRDLKVSGWESLRPYHIVYMRGNKLAEQKTAGMDVKTVTSPEQAFRMLMAGRADVVVEPRDLWFEMKRMNVAEVQMREPPLVSIPTYHYLNKRYEGYVQRLASILKRLHGSGTFKRIREEATGEKQTPR